MEIRVNEFYCKMQKTYNLLPIYLLNVYLSYDKNISEILMLPSI